MYRFEWKFQKKFICVLHTHLLNEIPTGLNNSLNPRLEHLAGGDDDLPVHAGHYLWDLGSKGGLGAMRLFTDLSINFAPRERIKKITILWAGRQYFLRPVVFQVSLQPAWVILAVWAREAFSTTLEVSHSANMFCTTMMVSLYYVIQEMLSFSMRPAKYFYDKLLPMYLDLKTVLIYRPHPVCAHYSKRREC